MRLKEIIDLIKDYYSKENNKTGGSLHIVLDDGNISDDNIKFCIDYAKKENDVDGVKIGELLLALSKTQIKKILDVMW